MQARSGYEENLGLVRRNPGASRCCPRTEHPRVPGGGTANTCSVYCIEHLGGYLVLSSGNNVYRLDRSDLVHGFEGRRVIITGTPGTKINEIHVVKIDLEEK
jgi:hypothetical protein